MARTLALTAILLILTMPLAFAAGVSLTLDVERIDGKMEYDPTTVPAQLTNTGNCVLDCVYVVLGSESDISREIKPGEMMRFNAQFEVPQCPSINCDVPITAICKGIAPDACVGKTFNDTEMVLLSGVKKYEGEQLPQSARNIEGGQVQLPQTGKDQFARIVVKLFSNNISDVLVGEKYTMKTTLINNWDQTIKCTYQVQGTNYREERVTDGLSPGSKTDFNIVFFVPEGCREPCSVTAHIICYDKAAADIIYETDVSFDLIGIRDEDFITKISRLLFIVLGAAGVGFVIWKGIGLIGGRIDRRKEREDESEGKRKLSAIMFTDVKGYSKEMGRDEESMLKKLWRYEKAMKQIVKEHDGRVVKTIGDAIMGDFDSAVNAVKAAMEIQDLLRKEDIKIRIGIHLGDVIHKGGDVFGDGVNIASRIESICEPGEIYISEDVYNQVKGKIRGDFQSLGRKPLKNIDVPPRVYKVR